MVIRDEDRWILDKIMELRSNETDHLFEKKGSRFLCVYFQYRYTEPEEKIQY